MRNVDVSLRSIVAAVNRVRGGVRGRCSLRVRESRVWVYALSEKTRSLFAHFEVPEFIADYFLSLPDRKLLSRCSLVATCLNEARSIEDWLESLKRQTMLPREIILCDGGSQDGTEEVVRNWVRDNPLPSEFVFLEAPGATIAEGRNRAIERASGDLLFLSDVGSVLDERWVEFMLVPFRHRADTEVVMGWYEPEPKETEQGFLSYVLAYSLPQIDTLNPETFLPSARSLALTKEAWLKAGKFPEYLSFAGEDSLFDYYLKENTERWAFVPDAVVQWQPPAKLGQFWKTLMRYAAGDAEGGKLAWSHYLWLMRPGFVAVAGLFLLLLGLAAWASREFDIGATLLLVGLSGALGAMFAVVRRFGVFSRPLPAPERLRHALAVIFLSSAQWCGFLRGLQNLSRVQRRRMHSGKGHVLFLGDDVFDREQAQKLLAEGRWVTMLSRTKREKQLFEHPRFSSFSEQSVDWERWLEVFAVTLQPGRFTVISRKHPMEELFKGLGAVIELPPGSTPHPTSELLNAVDTPSQPPVPS